MLYFNENYCRKGDNLNVLIADTKNSFLGRSIRGKGALITRIYQHGLLIVVGSMVLNNKPQYALIIIIIIILYGFYCEQTSLPVPS